VADLIRRHRRRIGDTGAAWPRAAKAPLVLVRPRRNETSADLAEALNVGIATAHRYVTEVVEPLPELAPDPREALR
jgi:hypothetical protein